MTSKSILVSLLTLFSILSHAQQSLYYYSADKKISILADSNETIVVPKEPINSDQLEEQLKKRYGSEAVRKFKSGKFITIKSGPLDKNQQTDLHNNSSIAQTLNGLKFADNEPLYLTGEILLQPKAGVKIDAVLSTLSKEQIKRVDKGKYDNYKLLVNDWSEIIPLANKIFESNLVVYSHPNYITRIIKHQYIPTDPFFAQQYYLNQGNNIDINAADAWEITRGCNSIRVAVIDDGVENHEDIQGRVLQGFTPTNVNGFGAQTNPAPPANLYQIGHGQACAGIIAATHDNVGIAGVAPFSQIIPINIFNDWEVVFNPNLNQNVVIFHEDIFDLAAAIDWAWDEGQADIISNSWGFTAQNANFDDITQAINRARTSGRGGSRGSLVVFASGNNNLAWSGVGFPASVNGVIAVGAIDRNGSIWNYSSRGSQLTLVAPSGDVNNNGDVITTDRMGTAGYVNGNYTTTFGGTSAAAPQVSGVAALVLSVNPNLTEAQLRTILQQTAVDMGPGGKDDTFGYGRVNALAAVQASIGYSISGPEYICSNGTYSIQNLPSGTSVTWSVTGALQISGVNTGSSVTITTNTSSSTGIITATVSGGLCAGVSVRLTKTIGAGNPVWPNYPGQNTPFIHYDPNPICINYQTNVQVMDYPLSISNNYSWSAALGVNLFSNYTDAWISASNTGTYPITVTTQGPCGPVSTYSSVNVATAGCFDGSGFFSFHPNPANEQLMVTFTYSDQEKTAVSSGNLKKFAVELYDENSKKIDTAQRINANSITLDTKEVLNGTYFLHIIENKAIIKKQVIISH